MASEIEPATLVGRTSLGTPTLGTAVGLDRATAKARSSSTDAVAARSFRTVSRPARAFSLATRTLWNARSSGGALAGKASWTGGKSRASRFFNQSENCMVGGPSPVSTPTVR